MSGWQIRKRFVGLAAVALVAGVALPAGAAKPPPAPLVKNGGFESGLTGWNNTASSCVLPSENSGASHSGNNSALFGCYLQANALSQSFKTRSGVTYQVEFWLVGGYNNGGSATQSFNATVAPARTPSATTSIFSDPVGAPDGSFIWQHITNTFTASSSSTVLSFTAQAQHGFYFLDDVVVTKTA